MLNLNYIVQNPKIEVVSPEICDILQYLSVDRLSRLFSVCIRKLSAPGIFSGISGVSLNSKEFYKPNSINKLT